MNKVLLLGHLGRDAELKFTQGGMAIGSFSMATSEKFKKDNQLQERTEWHRVKLFGKTAESLQRFLVKGKQVLIEGRIQTRSWDDQKSGEKRYSTEIVADHVKLLGGGNGNGGGRRNDAFDDANGDAGYDDFGGAGTGEVADADIPF